ncbi:MAG TPA: CPBP family intramembrane glutamic endopeptidase, partial [Bryobacteraceae bacterium]|nr:CPBP family intramembrane glutamic endopeptidase [Bryobacteraceae bacterium]
IILIAIIFSTPVQAGEEVGWRGYALPRMAARLGFGPASIVLGAIWGLWHLPLFFVPGEDYGQPFFVFAMGTTALSVAIAWLYANTKGSLLLTMLMHSAVNQTVGVIPDTLAEPGNPFSLHARIPFYLTVGFLWIAAGYFLFRFRRVPAAGVQKTAA